MPSIQFFFDYAALLDANGQLGPELVARAQSPEIKSQLRAQTDSAIAKGVSACRR